MVFHLRSIPLLAMETMIWLCKETIDTLIGSDIFLLLWWTNERRVPFDAQIGLVMFEAMLK